MFEEVFNKAGQSVRNNLNLQFRPTCRIESCKCPSPIYKDDSTIMVYDKTSTEWGDTVKKMIDEIGANSNKGFQKFIKNNTNLNQDTSIKHNNSNPLFHYNNHQPLKFDKCYISLARTIVRANGDMYPCVIKASNEIDHHHYHHCVIPFKLVGRWCEDIYFWFHFHRLCLKNNPHTVFVIC